MIVYTRGAVAWVMRYCTVCSNCVWPVLIISVVNGLRTQNKIMASRHSFSVRSLIAETPHSNHSQLAFFLKRGSPRLSTSGSCRRRLLKFKNLNSSPKVRRYLDLGRECSNKVGTRIGPLVTKESKLLEEPLPLTVFKYPGPGALFGKYVDIVGEMYPALRSRIISSPSFQHIFWLEILSPVLMYDVSLGPVSCLRLIISSGGVCSLQMYPLLRHVRQRKYMYKRSVVGGYLFI